MVDRICFSLNKIIEFENNINNLNNIINDNNNKINELVNIINDETEAENNKGDIFSEINIQPSQLVNLPDNLKIK